MPNTNPAMGTERKRKKRDIDPKYGANTIRGIDRYFEISCSMRHSVSFEHKIELPHTTGTSCDKMMTII